MAVFATLVKILTRLHDDKVPFEWFLLAASIAGVALIASAITAICRVLSKSDALSLALGTITLPTLICALYFYWVMTMEVDDPPPGNVLSGNLIGIAAVTPIALLASHITIRFLSRRALLNVR